MLQMSHNNNDATQKITLKEFTSDFFIKETCPIHRRKKHKNRSLSRSYLKSLRALLDKHINPVFGNFYVDDIEPKAIDDFIISMLLNDKYSGRWVNYTLLCLRLIFTEAERNRLINYNPAKKIQYVKQNTKTKGMLTTAEANTLMQKEYWQNEIFYMFNKTARYTGMRLGEIAALSTDDIRYENGTHYISVTKSYEFIEGLKETKTRINRIIPIPEWLAEELKNFNPGQKYMFSLDGKQPYKKSILSYRFRDALENIGISDEERRARNITFHSWRHRYISLLNGAISHEQLRLIVGHSQKATTNLYTHQIVGKATRILSMEFFKDIYE